MAKKKIIKAKAKKLKHFEARFRIEVDVDLEFSAKSYDLADSEARYLVENGAEYLLSYGLLIDENIELLEVKEI